MREGTSAASSWSATSPLLLKPTRCLVLFLLSLLLLLLQPTLLSWSLSLLLVFPLPLYEERVCVDCGLQSSPLELSVWLCLPEAQWPRLQNGRRLRAQFTGLWSGVGVRPKRVPSPDRLYVLHPGSQCTLLTFLSHKPESVSSGG